MAPSYKLNKNTETSLKQDLKKYFQTCNLEIACMVRTYYQEKREVLLMVRTYYQEKREVLLMVRTYYQENI